MKWNQHYNLKGRHAYLSPSQNAWARYSDDKFKEVYRNKQSAQYGSELHEYAEMAIRLGLKQPRSKKTLYSYINDSIGFGLSPEVVLYYSDNCFGTVDAIGIRNNKLYVFDLKTGMKLPTDDQLYIYAALYCLEYRQEPEDFDEIIMRYYWDDSVVEIETDFNKIHEYMHKIKHYDKLIITSNIK